MAKDIRARSCPDGVVSPSGSSQSVRQSLRIVATTRFEVGMVHVARLQCTVGPAWQAGSRNFPRVWFPPRSATQRAALLRHRGLRPGTACRCWWSSLRVPVPRQSSPDRAWAPRWVRTGRSMGRRIPRARVVLLPATGEHEHESAGNPLPSDRSSTPGSAGGWIIVPPTTSCGGASGCAWARSIVLNR